MRQTSVCINRVLECYVKFISWRLMQTLVFVEKVYNEN